MTVPERQEEAWNIGGLGDDCSPDSLARAVVTMAQREYVAPRNRRELGCEAVGLVTYAALLPIVAVLLSRDFVTVGGLEGWVGLSAVLLCVGLYCWPLTWNRTRLFSNARRYWWTLPTLPALALIYYGITVLHPYLDPSRPDRVKLAAEKVLSLHSNVEASRRPGWVFAYARQLEGQGDTEEARHYYRAGLRLDPTNEEAQARLAALDGEEFVLTADPRIDQRNPLTPDELAKLPLWRDRAVAARLERRPISPELSELNEVTAVIVPVGNVPDWLVDAIGAIIRWELGFPAIAASEAVRLPLHTRVRGVIIGRQWDHNALAREFFHQFLFDESFVSPTRWVLITDADIYSNNSNFLFSHNHPWGVVASYARFGDPEDDRNLMIQRMGKNVLSGLVKSFGVPISTDPNCVTSYTKGLGEFDAKGNRPNLRSLLLFREQLVARNRAWAKYRTERNQTSQLAGSAGNEPDAKAAQ
jgi:hypothetical protein